jgi:DNA replication licensing factor MCM7
MASSGFTSMKSGLKTDTFIEAMLIEKQKQGYNELELDLETEALVRSIGNDPDPYGRLAKSIAPEIYGHEDVKKALLLQLVNTCANLRLIQFCNVRIVSCGVVNGNNG